MDRQPMIYIGHDPRTGMVTIALYDPMILGPANLATMTPAEAEGIAAALNKHRVECEKKEGKE